MGDRIITATQRDLARHALGLPNSKRRSYRNHYVIGAGCDEHDDWTRMVEAGAAVLNRRRSGSPMVGGDDLFHLTRVGAEAALEPGERLDLEDFPDE